jgi:hypothetical protein
MTKRSWSRLHLAALLLAVALRAHAEITDTCDVSLWDHVYKPARLVVIHPCIWVTGTVVLHVNEPDGDVHIRLTLDAKYKPLLNGTNKARQGNDLVIELVCEHMVTQADAKAVCQGFAGNVTTPTNGTRVKVTGSYVHDVEGGHGWMEIHPVTSIEPTK